MHTYKSCTFVYTVLLTCISHFFQDSFQTGLRTLLQGYGLGVWERAQDAGKQPHPLVPVSPGQLQDVLHLIAALEEQ